MAIELISTVVPKNGQSFAIALANDIRGGLHSVDSIDERNAIPTDRLAEGMLCYVKGQGMFQYIQNEWESFTQSSHVVNTYEEMLQLDTTLLSLGTICYVIESGIYYLSINGWTPFGTGDVSQGNITGYHIGTTPPTNIDLIWIDTTYGELDNTLDSVVLDEFRATFSEMKSIIDTLRVEVALHTNKIEGLVTSNNNLKQTITELEDRIYNLEHNISVDKGEALSILTEDGSPLLCEDGTYLFMDIEN